MAKKGHKDLYPTIIDMAKKGMKGVDIAAELGSNTRAVSYTVDVFRSE